MFFLVLFLVFPLFVCFPATVFLLFSALRAHISVFLSGFSALRADFLLLLVFRGFFLLFARRLAGEKNYMGMFGEVNCYPLRLSRQRSSFIAI